MYDESKVRAVQHIMATLFSAQNALRELAPEFRWAGLGNLLGDYGEFVAGRDAAEVLQLREEPLDKVALTVQPCAEVSCMQRSSGT